jgi:sugar lactone lactonase YvrE
VPFIAAALQGNTTQIPPTRPFIEATQPLETFPTVQPIDTVDVEFPTVEPIPTSPPLETPTPENALANVLWSVGSEGTEPGQFNDARYMAVDGAGNVYIGEHQQGSRIQIFDSNGTFVTEWQIESDAYLTDLAAKSDGTLYVLMTRDIYVYEGSTGQLLDTYQLSDSVDALTVTGNDELYAVTGSNIVRFDESGQPTIVVNNYTDLFNAAFIPGDVAVDEAGNIYLSGSGVNNILKFSPDGDLTYIGEAGSGPDQLQTAPEAIATDGQGRIYASNFNGIQIYETEGDYVGNIRVEGFVFSLVFRNNDGQLELFALDRNANKLIKYEITEAN